MGLTLPGLMQNGNPMHEISPSSHAGIALPVGRSMPSSRRVETRIVAFPPGVTPSEAGRLLVDEAEKGRWELARVIVYRGGGRRVWLRRRVIPVEASLDA
jgi:hypothetical protein